MLKTVFLVLSIIAGGVLGGACGSAAQSETSAKASNSAGAGATENRADEPKAETGKNNAQFDRQLKKSDEAEKTESDSENPETLAATKAGFELRCGWYSNPTPGNHWLEDRDGQWIIGTQGARQAKGDYPPEFKPGEWVETNGNYGYGCACLQAKVNKKEGYITEIKSGYSKPLAACRNDRALKEPKDE